MVVTIDIKNLNVSRASIFSGSNTGGKKGPGNGGGILEDVPSHQSVLIYA
jgi:hypothetical protein